MRWWGVTLFMLLVGVPGVGSAAPEWKLRDQLGVSGQARNVFRAPVAVGLLGDGRVVALDREREVLVLFTDRGRYLRTLGGSRGVGNFRLRQPQGMAVDDEDRIWVADSGNHRVLVLAPEGTVVASYGSLGSSGERFRDPRDVAFDRGGRVYVADAGNQRIQVLRAIDGTVVDSWTNRTGGRRGYLQRPVVVAYSGRGDGGILVINQGAGRELELFDLDGRWSQTLTVPEEVPEPVAVTDVVVEPALYRVFLADATGGRVVVLDRRWELQTLVEAAVGESQPRGLAVTRKLDLYVADPPGRRIVHFSAR